MRRTLVVCALLGLASCKTGNSDSKGENSLSAARTGNLTSPAVPKNVSVSQLASESDHCIKLAMIEDIDNQEFNNLRAQDRLDRIFGAHVRSAQGYARAMNFQFDVNDQRSVKNYVNQYIAGTQKEFVSKAVKSTLQFVLPDRFVINLRNQGAKALVPTITRECGVFVSQRVKGVHALGAVAKVRWEFSSEATKKEFFTDDIPTGGLKALIRFSLANPLVPNVEVLKHFGPIMKTKVGQWLNQQPGVPLLEFIPGLGMQVFLDSKTFGFVAMESLAGQAEDQNFFKYSFSPDFSAHAPLDHITREFNPDLTAMEKRYKRNPLNSKVMNIVGKRFKQALEKAKASGRLSASAHGTSGKFKTNTFRIRTDGHFTNENVRRLIFRPIVDSRAATNNAPYSFSGNNHQNDFRVKLANLHPGDELYAVDVELYGKNSDGSVGAGEVKKRVAVIRMDSQPFPSHFGAFRVFFGHKLAKKQR